MIALTRTLNRRVLSSLLAALAGWLAAYAATLPMQAFRIHQNTGDDVRLFAFDMGFGALVWAAWTLGIAASGWLLGCVPVAAFLPTRLLLTRRRATLVLATMAAWTAVLLKFRVWGLFGPEPYMNFWLFWLYSILFMVFALITTLIYLRQISRAASNEGRSR